MLFFAYFSVSEKHNIKWSPNGIKPSGTRFSHQIRPRRLGPSVKKATRRSQGWRASPSRARPLPRGPLVAPPTYFFLLYIPIHPGNTIYEAKTLFPLPQPSVPVRSHLGAISSALPEGELITVGFYINTIASPMMCE